MKWRRKLNMRSRRSGKRKPRGEQREQSGEDGGGRVEAWLAVWRDVPLETEYSPTPDEQIFDAGVRGRRSRRSRRQGSSRSQHSFPSKALLVRAFMCDGGTYVLCRCWEIECLWMYTCQKHSDLRPRDTSSSDSFLRAARWKLCLFSCFNGEQTNVQWQSRCDRACCICRRRCERPMLLAQWLPAWMSGRRCSGCGGVNMRILGLMPPHPAAAVQDRRSLHGLQLSPGMSMLLVVRASG